MRVYENFPFRGFPEIWRVPKGVTEAVFECWGAAGGAASGVVDEIQTGRTHSDNAPANIYFNNGPGKAAEMGRSFANNAGFVAGVKKVKEGESYRITVGGNGGGGFSAIKKNANGTFSIGRRGGKAGYNGGGAGGMGAHVYQNLFNAPTNKVAFSQGATPASATAGQLWHRTDTDVVYRCKKKYTSGGSIANNWVAITDFHQHFVGRSGGGGGGATDIRFGGSGLQHRILVAGGGGGAGGGQSFTGTDKWTLATCPEEPSPPFGTDDQSTGPTGVNKTWASRLTYFASGWGIGGIGGGTGPKPGTLPAGDGGTGTVGGAGGVASGRHKTGTVPPPVAGSGGKGGSPTSGGSRGAGGAATNGLLGTGGAGANAAGGTDDFAAGGGGGGGGYYGGGGGGHGFLVLGGTYRKTQITTQAGGGGGGSSYASPVFTAAFFAAAARPPQSATNKSTGANGRGGFARVRYSLPPRALWSKRPSVAVAAQPFTVEFDYEPALAGGAEIDYYTVGFDDNVNATFPSTQEVIDVEDRSKETHFTYEGFVGPAAGSKRAFFVKAVDTDGDSSEWAKVIVLGVAAPAAGAAITSPPSGDQFIDSKEVAWTLGSQSPLIAYRLGLSGKHIAGPSGRPFNYNTGWRPGGTRANLATDPGFKTAAVWSSDANAALTSSATFPGASGSSGRIAWTLADDGSAEQHTTAWDNLVPGRQYRVSLKVASGNAADTRLVEIRVEDETGLLESAIFDPAGSAAGTYKTLEVPFTPQGQGVRLRVIPSDTAGTFGNAETGQITHLADLLLEFSYAAEFLMLDDFEDGIADWEVGGTAATLTHGLEFYTGSRSLKATLTANGNPAIRTKVAASPKVHPGDAVIASGRVQASVAARAVQMVLTWRNAADAIISTTFGAPITATLDTWVEVTVSGNAPATAAKVEIGFAFGGALTGDVFDFDLVAVRTHASRPYFDGTTANGNPGAPSWTGAVNASASLLTGTDVLAGELIVKDTRLTDGLLYLDTLNDDAVVLGDVHERVSIPVTVNRSIPVVPEIEIIFNNPDGLVEILIDANDAAVSNKTISFDIYRNDVRIVTGLRPDRLTRLAEYADTPAHGEEVSYMVRALDSDRGYTDRSDGTVTIID